MKINKPKFWDSKKGFISSFLLPLSYVIEIIISIKKKILKPQYFNIPVICVGNIYIGGTGKTPLTVYIAKQLLEAGKKPAILKKYYKKYSDENDFIKNNFKNFILDKDRVTGIKIAKDKNFDTVILDDGFQDYKIKKNLNITCFNQKQLIGNGYVFPAGPLRESLSALKNSQIVVINGEKDIEFEKKLFKVNGKLSIFYSKYKPINLDNFKNQKLLAFAGIGNPVNFFSLLENNNLIVSEKISFPDHYDFTEKEILNIIKVAKNKNLKIITTEKDYFRIKKFKIDKINYIKLKLEIENGEDFFRKINQIYD